MQRFLMTLMFAVLLPSMWACQPVQEPWLRHPDQLQAERSRSPEAHQVLKYRLFRVQTDR